MANKSPHKILIVDDNAAIHDDFRKILSSSIPNDQLNAVETALFGEAEPLTIRQAVEAYQIDSAYQGSDALSLVKKSIEQCEPYSVAFIDMRMPPGWDGVLTTKQIWEIDPAIQVVICTAYADYSWEEIVNGLGFANNFLILKKPFDMIEIRQLALSLIKKWELALQVKEQLLHLNEEVASRTIELEKSLSLIQATFEATPEGTIAISQDKKIVNVNQVFKNQWKLTEENIRASQLETIIEMMAEQTVEPRAFFKVLTRLCDNPKADYIIEWKLTSGRILELYTQPQQLHGKIIGSVLSFRDITERKRLEDELLHQATHDSLTGLPNRVLLVDRFNQAIANARRYETTFATLLIDLDNFKIINDSFGHEAGDQLLKLIGQRFLNNLSMYDSLIRLGGDEFVVILSCGKEDKSYLEKARVLLDSILVPAKLSNHTVIVSGSIGISLYLRDGDTADELLRNADAALYKAKELGRNTCQEYVKEFNEDVLQHTQLATLLRSAIADNQLFLQYQPLYQTKTGDIFGAEALIRWQHPELGVIYPNFMIPLAEETGLIMDIGEWVLKEVCKKSLEWQKLSPGLVLAINISGYQFRQKEFIDNVNKIIKESGVNPKLLEFEMTESLLFKNIPETAMKMDELKKMGINISIDDFGTGYASFSYLKNFPFDKIKIDKSFIDDVHKDESAAAIVEAIVTMSRRMGIKAVAEGVENKQQLDFLIKFLGDQVQGYYYSRPLGELDFIALLKKEIPVPRPK